MRSMPLLAFLCSRFPAAWVGRPAPYNADLAGRDDGCYPRPRWYNDRHDECQPSPLDLSLDALLSGLGQYFTKDQARSHSWQ